MCNVSDSEDNEYQNTTKTHGSVHKLMLLFRSVSSNAPSLPPTPTPTPSQNWFLLHVLRYMQIPIQGACAHSASAVCNPVGGALNQNAVVGGVSIEIMLDVVYLLRR